MALNSPPQPPDRRVASRIYGHGVGWVFSPTDLADLGDSASVAAALLGLQERGTIRRLAEGLYDYPGKPGQPGKRGQPRQPGKRHRAVGAPASEAVNQTEAVTQAVRSRIHGHGRGWVFTPSV